MRRAKLYYLRGRRGKSARIPERQVARGKQKEVFKGFTKPKGEPDDLKLIAGITPELEKKLNKLGLIKFDQIANLTDDEIAKVDDTLSLNGAIENDDWIAKAVALMAETTAGEVPAEEEGEIEGGARRGRGRGAKGQTCQEGQEVSSRRKSQTETRRYAIVGGSALCTFSFSPEGSSTVPPVAWRSPTCFCTKDPMKAPSVSLARSI